MDGRTDYEVAGGTVTGRHHVQTGRNNQDAFAFRSSPAGLAAIVCDGCSGAPHSGLGARLGADLLATAISRALQRGSTGPQAVDEALEQLLARLGPLADAMGEKRAVVADALLFTVVGLVVSLDCAWSFAIGDGLIAVDGKPEILGPFEGNQPPYLGYSLLRTGSEGDCATAGWGQTAAPAGGLRLERHGAIATAVIGTDGAAPLADRLGDLVREDLVYRNPDIVRRRLTVLGRERKLADDATLVLIRRRRAEGGS
jgi:hypothetical protein